PPGPEARFKERHDLLGHDIADDDERRVAWPEARRVKPAEIIGRKGFDRRRRAEHWRSESVRWAVQHALKGNRRNGWRGIPRLQESNEPLLPEPLELVARKARSRRDVRHDRQSLAEA